jgi:hypothetical protein
MSKNQRNVEKPTKAEKQTSENRSGSSSGGYWDDRSGKFSVFCFPESTLSESANSLFSDDLKSI